MELLNVLMRRDGMAKSDALDLMRECRERILNDGEDPEDVLAELGLEPDYIFDLI
jgi:hypothetical protein